MDDATPEFVRVLRSDDLVACEGMDSLIVDVPVGDETVLVGRMGDGEVVAFAMHCPHETTDLRGATFVDGLVRCPRHNYLYDPFTGENVVPARISRPESMCRLRPGYLPIYAVGEEDGWVWVCTVAEPPPESWDPALEVPPAEGTRASIPRVPEPEAPKGPVVHEPEHIRVKSGQEFELALPLGSAPAHAWSIAPPTDTVEVFAQRFDAGPPAYQRYQVEALNPGLVGIRCSYGRPWDKEPAEIRTFIIEVS